jgi:hypothetical protein
MDFGGARYQLCQGDPALRLSDPLDEIAFVGDKDQPKILSHGLGFGTVTWHCLLSTVFEGHLKLAWWGTLVPSDLDDLDVLPHSYAPFSGIWKAWKRLWLRRWTQKNRASPSCSANRQRGSVDPNFQATIWASRHLEVVIVNVQDGAVATISGPWQTSQNGFHPTGLQGWFFGGSARAIDSGHPGPVTHDGTPSQVLGLSPDLDALRCEDQVHVVAAVGLGSQPAWAAYPLASAAGAFDSGTVSARTASIMMTSRVSPKARRTRELEVTLATVREPGSVARTIWLPFQVWLTGTR